MIDFNYNIIDQSNVRIVTFKGRMGKESRQRLEACRQELVGEHGKMLILMFKDVPVIEPSIFRELVLLQQELRKKNKGLYIVGVNSQLKQYLLEKAVLRHNELKSTLDELLQSLSKA